MVNIQTLVDRIIEITDQMIAFAEQSEWEAMMGIHEGRQALYQELEVAYQEAPELFDKPMLVQLKQKNDSLLYFSAQIRKEAQTALSELRSRQKAANAYESSRFSIIDPPLLT